MSLEYRTFCVLQSHRYSLVSAVGHWSVDRSEATWLEYIPFVCWQSHRYCLNLQQDATGVLIELQFRLFSKLVFAVEGCRVPQARSSIRKKWRTFAVPCVLTPLGLETKNLTKKIDD